MTANLHQLTLDEALNGILKLCNLVAQRDGDMIYVYTSSELPQLDLDVHVFSLDYVAASDVLATVQGLLSPAGRAFISESSSTDNRKTQESLVVQDRPAHIQRVERYLFQVDQPPRQGSIGETERVDQEVPPGNGRKGQGNHGAI